MRHDGEEAVGKIQLLLSEPTQQSVDPCARACRVASRGDPEAEELVRSDCELPADLRQCREVRLPRAVRVIGVAPLSQPETPCHFGIRQSELSCPGLQPLSDLAHAAMVGGAAQHG